MKNQENTELKGGEIAEEKIKSSENLNNLEVEEKMAYYCKLCGCWHYPSSRVYYAHKIYASQQRKPRKVVKRKKKKSFWDRW